MRLDPDLLAKYDIPVPRYTSYPTVPYWSDSPTTDQWLDSLRQSASVPGFTWSMYLHVPFCESLCTYCGCNTVISKNHDRESHYVDLVLRELEEYRRQVPELFRRPIRQMHLGGGTPTFLSVENLRRLCRSILETLSLDDKMFVGSIEVDPRRTSNAHLQALYELGFRRVSMGVQDFNPDVQKVVNRIQPLSVTRNLTEAAREMGYQSTNYDLIYGLPKQSMASFIKTIEQTIALRPDRIALYSLAVVPWIKPAQRLFKDEDLPDPVTKRQLFEMAYGQLLDAGYMEIGMDHFALPTDSLARALSRGQLHRNFMGYTDLRTDVLLGLGVSSISETPDCFHQNEKVLPIYERTLSAGQIPTLRGHKLTGEDRRQRELILKFMNVSAVELPTDAMMADVSLFLRPMIEDGLVELDGRWLRLTEKGRPFLRNACMAFDLRLRRDRPAAKVFSQAV